MTSRDKPSSIVDQSQAIRENSRKIREESEKICSDSRMLRAKTGQLIESKTGKEKKKKKAAGMKIAS